MAGDDRQDALSPDEIAAARIRALDAVKRDIENAADEQGNVSAITLYGLIDTWNRSIKYGDKDVLELAEALDVPNDWYKQLTTQYGQKTPGALWGLLAGILGATILVGVFGRSNVVLGAACGAVAWAFYRVGRAAGRIRGYDDGLCAGHSAAVFQAHGIEPGGEGAFWKTHGQTLDDKHIADFYRDRGSRGRK